MIHRGYLRTLALVIIFGNILTLIASLKKLGSHGGTRSHRGDRENSGFPEQDVHCQGRGVFLCALRYYQLWTKIFCEDLVCTKIILHATHLAHLTKYTPDLYIERLLNTL